MDRRGVVSPDSALAAEVFDQFCAATTFKTIIGHHRHLCQLLHIQPTNFPHFYPKLKLKLRSWKAQALWNKFDKRALHKCYNRGRLCPNTRVLVIGAGPCGLRSAIEAQLLGAKVVVIEKRDRISRNNVLHLWPFVIHDLRCLGAKKFFGRFCAGAIDHISIRQIQCILLKVALIFGVEIHEGVSFEDLLPPPDDQEKERIGWRAVITPSDHPVSQYEFDVLIGADGKRNTLDGFKRKEFRGKLAIAITANFINRHTEAEARVEEISGVAFIFNQKFFKDLYATTGIDLENIVYYKDDTHYFVMTAKKHSLIDKGVILNDYVDTARLLAAENVDKTALMEYAREAADFSTGCRLPQLEFALNHYGQPDIAMFDFTSMYAAENASRVVEKKGHRLLVILVGDSLLEPFWPTGSGCARGFLSSLDACWAIRSWAQGAHPLQVLAERESIYRLLAQTTPENLHRDLQSYTLDPHTRYPNLNSQSVLPMQVKNLYYTDDPTAVELFLKAPSQQPDVPKKRRRRDSQVHPDTLLHWLQKQVALYESVKIEDMTTSFKDGLALCAIIHRYRPHLIDFHTLNKEDIAKNNQLAFEILERELAIPPVMTGEEMAECDVPDKLTLISYLSQVYDTFKGEIPHIKHPKLEESDLRREEPARTHSARLKTLQQMSPAQRVSLLGKLTGKSTRRRRSNLPADFYKEREQTQEEKERRAVLEEKIRSLEQVEKHKMERMMRRRYLHHLKTKQFNKSMQMLQGNDRDTHFEDYNIFLYRQTAPDFKDRVKMLEIKLLYPDRDNRLGEELKKIGALNDEDFSGRVKSIEAKLRGTVHDKKPKDLNRAIGKIEKTDWNVKEIEKKIEENRMGRGTSRQKAEKVPKWSKEQFEDKFSAMEKKLKGRNEMENKYSEIDTNLQKLEKKMKEGSVLEQGQRGANKVSAMAAHLATIHQEPQQLPKPTNGRTVTITPQGASEMCHFCNKRVYLMERLSAEGKFFHRGCFRCQYCSTTLRLGSYLFDRDGKYGSRFFCTQHFGMQGVAKRVRQAEERSKDATPTKQAIPTPDEEDNIVGTPERVEFENLSDNVEVEEDEWTDRNFGASANEASSDTDPSDLSESSSESEDGDAFAEALDTGLNAEETLRLAQDWTRRYASQNDSDTHCSYQDGDTDEEESDTATEGEEEIRARELRKQEVPQEPVRVDSGSETEVASDDYSTSSSSEESEPEDNSATEISTDSEFEHDGTTHPIPDIVISDVVQVKRGHLEQPKKVQLVPTKQLNGNVQTNNKDVKLELNKLTEEKKPSLNLINNNDKLKPAALVNPNRGNYLLNRTQSTEGIASKISLELKKKYLLGPSGFAGNVRKSGSASTLDSKFKSLIDQISEQQKLLNPAPEPSPTMQAFLQGADKLRTSPIVNSMPHLLAKKELPPCEEFKHVCSLKDKDIESINEGEESNKAQEEIEVSPKEIVEVKKTEDEDFRARSPVHETSIVVPVLPRNEEKDRDIESDSLSSDDSSSEDEDSDHCEGPMQSPPKLEIHNSRGELMEADDLQPLDSLNICNIPDVVQKEVEYSEAQSKIDLVPTIVDNKETSLGRVITVPSPERCDTTNSCQVLKKVTTPAELFVSKDPESLSSDVSRSSSPASLKNDSESFKNESMAAALTETELSDWARDEDTMVSDTLDELDFNINPQFITFRKHHTPRSKRSARGVAAKIAKTEDFDEEFTHICGKGSKSEMVPISDVLHNIDNLEFMDTGGEEESSSDEGVRNKSLIQNRGYVQFVNPPDDEEDLPTPVAEAYNYAHLDDDDSKRTEFTDTTTSEATTVKDSPLEPTKSVTTSPVDIKSDSIVEDIKCDGYAEYVQRLQGRISPFGNVRDSIDIRKSRKPKVPLQISLSPPPSEQAMSTNQNSEEKLKIASPTSKKLEQLSRERTIQKDLVHEMVLNKVLSQSKSSQEKRSKRYSRGSSSPLIGSQNSITGSDRSLSRDNSKLTTPEDVPKTQERPKSVFSVETNKDKPSINNERRCSLQQETPLGLKTPTNLQEIYFTPMTSMKPETRQRASTVSSYCKKVFHPTSTPFKTPTSAGYSLPDIHKVVENEKDLFKTPLANSKLRLDLRESARAKFKMMSDEELGLSPEEKMKQLREKVQKHLNEPSEKSSSSSSSKGNSEEKEEKKKSKDSDRRKSIIQAVSDFFLKKSPSPPKTPSSQSPTKLFKFRHNKYKDKVSEVAGPPVPPLPQSYTPSQEDSLSEEDSKATHSEDNTSLLKKQRTSQRLARQAQNKRLRMAQEIQRQLEELEVKQRELEAQGVALEKALRGEDPDCGRDDQGLLSEWFTLMRERTDVRRYENELMVRAQELELEDRHSRLQLELKNLLSNNEGKKTNEDVALEGRILREMLEIVERRNALGSQLEAERQRYQEEDKDMEAQMLAKGLRLTPLRKSH